MDCFRIREQLAEFLFNIGSLHSPTHPALSEEFQVQRMSLIDILGSMGHVHLVSQWILFLN